MPLGENLKIDSAIRTLAPLLTTPEPMNYLYAIDRGGVRVVLVVL